MVLCETKTGHSSAPWLYINAIEKVFEIWSLIKNLRMPGEELGSHFHSLSMNLRSIEGGTESSIVPPRCKAIIEIRIPPTITVSELIQEVLNIIECYREENPNVMVMIEILDSTEPYIADKKSILVRAFSRAIWKKRNEQVKLINKSGTGDMNIFGRRTSIPVITYGPGDPHLDHTSNEHIVFKDYMDAIDILVDAMKRLYELHHRGC
jgi:LysW-gamma-L-lysine carboxypeptidase